MSHSVCDMLTLPGISTVDHRAKRILVFAKARVYGTFLDKDIWWTVEGITGESHMAYMIGFTFENLSVVVVEQM